MVITEFYISARVFNYNADKKIIMNTIGNCVVITNVARSRAVIMPDKSAIKFAIDIIIQRYSGLKFRWATGHAAWVAGATGAAMLSGSKPPFNSARRIFAYQLFRRPH